MNSFNLKTDNVKDHSLSVGGATGKLVLNCSGGLGNQLFMYAAGRYLAQRFGRSLELVRPKAERQRFQGFQRPFQLDRFRISEPVREAGLLDRLFFSKSEKVRRWRPHIARTFGADVIEEHLEYCFQRSAINVPEAPRTYVSGYWQVAGYAQTIEPDLREIFTLRSPARARTLEYANIIERATNPVSVHLRLGDYAQIFHSTADDKKVSNVLPFRYYQQAIDALKERFEGLMFIVFSDEPETAKLLMQGVTPSIFIDGNGADYAFEDLWLLSQCNHNIIANSSFSWWGAWLNPRRDKHVYVPRYWLNTRASYFPDLYPAGWTLIDNVAENAV